MKLILRPIDRWPHPELTAQRSSTPFSSTYSATVVLLDRELRHLGADHAILMLAVREDDIRLDGELRANARPAEHPGVVIAFDSKYGSIKYACDRFTHWHANLRGIALGLEALRKVERYGITSRGEQYTGFRALGAGIALSSGFATDEDAGGFICLHARDDRNEAMYDIDDVTRRVEGAKPPFLEDAYRRAAKRLHPDNPITGDAELFKRLNAAHDLLDR